MNPTFHLSIGVQDIDQSITFFTKVLPGTVTHNEHNYTNIDLFGHQITLKPNAAITHEVLDFHFGFNMTRDEFDSIATYISINFPERIQMEPKLIDAGKPMERKKMYLKCPTGYLIELKGYR